MKKNIITISREFGSGGRTIGKTVSRSAASPPPGKTALPTPFWAGERLA